MLFCANCGREVARAFCGHCGAPVTPIAPSSAQEVLAPHPSTDGARSVNLRKTTRQARLPAPPITNSLPLAPNSTEEAGYGHASGPGRTRVLWGAVAAVFLLAGGVAGLGWQQGWFTDDPASATAGPPTPRPATTDPGTEVPNVEPAPSSVMPSPTEFPSSPVPAPTVSTPSPTPLSRDAAIFALEDLVSKDAGLDPVRGQWVAQLSSKYEGVVDTSQQATPFTPTDILAEIERLRANGEYGSSIRVVHQGDWGGSTARATPMWVTFADLDLTSRNEVVAWCESHFTQRGKALLNACYPRELKVK